MRIAIISIERLTGPTMNHTPPTRPIVAWIATAMIATIGVTALAQAQPRTLTLADLYDPARRIDFDGTIPRGLTWVDAEA